MSLYTKDFYFLKHNNRDLDIEDLVTPLRPRIIYEELNYLLTIR